MLSKTGCHVILTTPAAMRFAAASPIVKQLDGIQALQAAPDGAVRVFRAYFDDQNSTYALTNPGWAWQRVKAGLKGYNHPRLYVQALCEFSQGDRVSLLAFTAGFVAAAHADGYKVVGFNFSTGNPQVADVAYYRANGWGGVDAIGCDEYWGDEGFTADEALRHRIWHQNGDPPIVITECGRDSVEQGTAGWEKSNVTAAQYIGEIVAYDAALQQDDYVLGAVVFTSGPSQDWQNYSTDDISDQLIQEDTNVDEATQNALIAMEAKQNTLLTEALKRFRQGKFDGADGIDGLIVALEGGKPLDFTPSYPPKA